MPVPRPTYGYNCATCKRAFIQHTPAKSLFGWAVCPGCAK